MRGTRIARRRAAKRPAGPGTTRTTGSRLKTRPVSPQTSSVRAPTDESTSSSVARGSGKVAGNSDGMAGIATRASPRPTAPAASVTSTLSIASSWTSRHWPAPRLMRNASSGVRFAARMSTRLATLAQASSSRHVTDPRITHRIRRTGPTVSSSSGNTEALQPGGRLGVRSWMSRATTARMSERAASSVRPRLIRATVTRLRPPGGAAGSITSGMYSCPMRAAGNAKPAGITPTISRGPPFTSIDLPMTSRAPP